MVSCCDIHGGIALKLHSDIVDCGEPFPSKKSLVCLSSHCGVLSPMTSQEADPCTKATDSAPETTKTPLATQPSTENVDAEKLKNSDAIVAAESKNAEKETPGTPIPQKDTSLGPSNCSECNSYAALDKKYSNELKFMLREFQKLEQQLMWKHPGRQQQQNAAENSDAVSKDAKLPVPAPGSKIEGESAAARNRREKLQSFISQLQDILKQILSNSESPGGDPETQPSKDVQDNVKQLEQHILTNILPVKVRLLKQISAQGRHLSHKRQHVTGYPDGSTRPTTARDGQNKKSNMPFAFASTSRLKGGSSLTQKLYGVGRDKKRTANQAGLTAPGSTDSAEAKPSSEVPALLAPAVESLEPAVDPAATVQGAPTGTVVSQTSQAPPEVQPVLKLESDATAATQVATPVTSVVPVAQAPNPARSTAENDCKAQEQPQCGPVHMVDGAATAQQIATVQSAPNDPMVSSKAQAGVLQPCAQQQPGVVPSPARLQNPCVAPAKKAKKRKKKKRRNKHFHANNHVMMGTTGHASMHSRDNHGMSTAMPAFSTFCCHKNSSRNIEYICASCNEVYQVKALAASTPFAQAQGGSSGKALVNPWWALRKEACPKCSQIQIPRIDIAAPANYMEYHPALLAHAMDDSGGSAHHASQSMTTASPSLNARAAPTQNQGRFGPNTGAFDGSGSDDDEYTDGSGYTDDSCDDDNSSTTSHDEDYGSNYAGPKLDDLNAARVLILMDHASTCPGRHKNPRHAEVCRSTKFLMLHVRDCPGTLTVQQPKSDSTGPKGENDASVSATESQADSKGANSPTTNSTNGCSATGTIPCPFPWCRPVKHLLYHLLSCTAGRNCRTCHPRTISDNMATLTSLNAHRKKKRRVMAEEALKDAGAVHPAECKSCSTEVPVPTNAVEQSEGDLAPNQSDVGSSLADASTPNGVSPTTASADVDKNAVVSGEEDQVMTAVA